MIPHLAWPVQVTQGGALSVLEQDSPAEIGQCVAALLATPAGSRIELPTYGITDPVFTGGQHVAAAQQTISTWEPRASAAQLSMRINNDGTAQLHASLPVDQVGGP